MISKQRFPLKVILTCLLALTAFGLSMRPGAAAAQTGSGAYPAPQPPAPTPQPGVDWNEETDSPWVYPTPQPPQPAQPGIQPPYPAPISPAAPQGIAFTSLPVVYAVEGNAYLYNAYASNGTVVPGWPQIRLLAGPAWLALTDHANGSAALEGTAPALAGSFSVSLQATDAAGAAAVQSFTITVGPPPPYKVFFPLMQKPTTPVFLPFVAVPPPPPPPAAIYPEQVIFNVNYCTVDGVSLLLDLIYPSSQAAALPHDGTRYPVVINIHGGYWSHGDKSGAYHLKDFTSELAHAGYVVAALNYRLAPAYKFPAMIEDVKCATRFLRASADAYDLNAYHFGAIGDSAGGHLAALLGLTTPAQGWDVGDYLHESSRVRAVVELAGINDLTRDLGTLIPPYLSSVFGASNLSSPILVRASPVTYAASSNPPVLMLQGLQDTVVPPVQAQDMYNRLVSVQETAKLIYVQNAGHTFYYTNVYMDPSYDELANQVVGFMDQYVK